MPLAAILKWLSRKPAAPVPVANAGRFTHPPWQGGDPGGRTILVWHAMPQPRQAPDAAMLARLLRDGARLVVECDPACLDDLARALPGVEVVPRNDPPHPRTQCDDIEFQAEFEHLARGSLRAAA